MNNQIRNSNEMKQLLITLKTSCKELEAKDFLKETKHSPQWIGNVEDWKIKTVQTTIDSKDKLNVTALLNNDNWTAPELEAITGADVKAVISEDAVMPVSFAPLTGLYGHLLVSDSPSFISPISTELYDYIVFECESCSDAQKTESKELLKHLGFWPSYGDVWDAINDVVFKCKEDQSKKVAVTFGRTPCSKIHPVTEARVVNGKLVLIYNQDVNLRDIK